MWARAQETLILFGCGMIALMAWNGGQALWRYLRAEPGDGPDAHAQVVGNWLAGVYAVLILLLIGYLMIQDSDFGESRRGSEPECVDGCEPGFGGYGP